MPKRSPADRANASAKYHRAQIEKARELARQDPENQISAPLAAAVRWLYAGLAQAAKHDPQGAAAMYEHAVDQIARYAESVQGRTASKADKPQNGK